MQLQSVRKSDRRKTSRRLVANGAMSRKSDAMFGGGKTKEAKVVLQRTSDYSSEEGDGAAYQVYKQAGDWWKCVLCMFIALHV